MAKIPVSIVHDETGRIVAVARPEKDANVVVLSGDGESVLETEMEEEEVAGLISGSQRVDVENKAIRG